MGGDRQKEGQVAKVLVAGDDGHTNLLSNIGNVYFNQGKLEEALESQESGHTNLKALPVVK